MPFRFETAPFRLKSRQMRATRRHLRHMGDSVIRDMGFDPADIRRDDPFRGFRDYTY